MQQKKFGKSNYIIHAVDKDVQLTASEVLSSWTNNTFLFPEEKTHKGEVIRKGFRNPQRGALYAIKAHWTVSNNTATIVMLTRRGMS